jgi:hypothetical protein
MKITSVGDPLILVMAIPRLHKDLAQLKNENNTIIIHVGDNMRVLFYYVHDTFYIVPKVGTDDHGLDTLKIGFTSKTTMANYALVFTCTM